MKKNSTKPLYTVLGIALFLAIFNAIHVSVFCIGAFIEPENWGVEWLEYDTWMQYAVLIGRMIGGLAFSAVAGYDMVRNHINCFKGMGLEPEGEIRDQYVARRYTEVVTG